MNRLSSQRPTFANNPAAALEFYQEFGYHVEPEVWSSKECQEIITASEQFPSYKEGIFAPLMQPQRTDPFFMQAFKKKTIVDIVEQICGGTVSGLACVMFYGLPGTPGFTMHQDNGVVEAKPDTYVSAWSAMQDVTLDMGVLVGYPGTHREPILDKVETGVDSDSRQDPNALHEEIVLPEGYQGIDLPLSQGSTLFMHSHFVHSSRTNESDRSRRALLLTYIRSGEPFRAGFRAKRAEIDVH